MKITPRTYARALVSSLENEADAKAIIKNFLHLLQRRRQIKLLPKILSAFETEWAQKHGIIRLDVTYPAGFKESVTQLAENLERESGKKVEVSLHSSEELIGGLKIVHEDTMIDGSLSGQLTLLAHRLAR